MITVFSEHITNRLTYVLDFCFKAKGKEYKIIDAVDAWEISKHNHINYSNLELDADINIPPQGILFESEIYANNSLEIKGNQLLMDGVYDKFGLIFYFLTQYESYEASQFDEHGRELSHNHPLVKLNLQKTPVVDRLVMEIWEELGLDYSEIAEGYSFTPTFDIDVAWAYKHRSFIRSIGATLKGKQPLERIQVMMGLKKDPYDTYDLIREIATKTERIFCFILLGDWGKFDKNIHWENNAYGSLIRGLNLEGEVGIHPSYDSYLNRTKVANERKRLANITGHKIDQSRQHFLRVKVPTTYEVLQDVGIKSDYSMGFADNIGFKAGTAFPFYFFNLRKNKVGKLKIHPFMYLDGALKDYLKLAPEEGLKEVKSLINEVKIVGGDFNFIWHNSSIHNQGEWKNWQAVLMETVEFGISK